MTLMNQFILMNNKKKKQHTEQINDWVYLLLAVIITEIG